MDEWIHPCQKCGACCTTFCVAFSSSEISKDHFGVPSALTYKISSDTSAMRTKNSQHERCIALEGHIGKQVGCRIYTNRPSPCRNFKASYEDGEPNQRCDECRLARGMKPLTPRDWEKIKRVELEETAL